MAGGSEPWLSSKKGHEERKNLSGLNKVKPLGVLETRNEFWDPVSPRLGFWVSDEEAHGVEGFFW